MLNAFEPIYDFTNWPLLFHVYHENRHDEKTLYAICSIIDVKLRAILRANVDDDRLKAFDQHAVEYLFHEDGLNMYAVVYVLKLIYAIHVGLQRLDDVRQMISSIPNYNFHFPPYFVNCLSFSLLIASLKLIPRSNSAHFI